MTLVIKKININTIKEIFAFDTISSMNDLEFEQNLKSKKFFVKTVNIYFYT